MRPFQMAKVMFEGSVKFAVEMGVDVISPSIASTVELFASEAFKSNKNQHVFQCTRRGRVNLYYVFGGSTSIYHFFPISCYFGVLWPLGHHSFDPLSDR